MTALGLEEHFVHGRQGLTKDAKTKRLPVVPPEQIRNGTVPGGRNETRMDSVVWTAELDAIVHEGYSRGWSGAREAINKIQSLRPKWRSHNVWDRATQLGFDHNYVQERPPWSAGDDEVLRDFAREQSVKTLARWLHRSEAAVRGRFAKLGESARVQDNYTQEELARDLRVSPKTVRRWEAAGLLERRDGRITHESLQEFCRNHASEINHDLLDKEMQGWLRDYAGFVPADKQLEKGRGALKHLQKVGVCPRCGRRTRGNAHARHLTACARKAGVKKPVPAQGFDGKSANRPLVL